MIFFLAQTGEAYTPSATYTNLINIVTNSPRLRSHNIRKLGNRYHGYIEVSFNVNPPTGTKGSIDVNFLPDGITPNASLFIIGAGSQLGLGSNNITASVTSINRGFRVQRRKVGTNDNVFFIVFYT